MPTAECNGLSIYFEDKGEGDPVLFIGGTGADLRAKPNVLDGPLPKSFHVTAYDQRGLGQSDKPQLDYTMSDYADDAAALIRARGWAQAHVVGVSFGGMVALHLALQHPETIDKLVLCCTSPGGSMPSYPFHELPADITPKERMTNLMGVNDTRKDESWQAEHAEQIEKMFQHTIDHAIADHQTPTFQEGARRQLLARAGHDVVAQLGDIPHATMVCAGKYDGIAPVENQYAMASKISNSELCWYEGGHPFLIQDKKALPDIIEFLSSH
jgi:3-oxoadipate enol-lactonase